MARTWVSIRVELIDGMHAQDLWPRPGRLLLARPGMTFRMLADAINDAFARWDRAHLHAFTLADGTRIALRGPWDEPDDVDLDDTAVTLRRLKLGEQFTFEFDFGDSWMHLCTVGDERVDPYEVYGESPDRPVAYFGWGWIPDQYGRRWEDDDGESPVPPQPDQPSSDLPDLHDMWGVEPGGQEWTYEAVQDLRKAAGRGDVDTVVVLLRQYDALAVAHVAAPTLLAAAELAHGPARALITGLLDRIHDRGWPGDHELLAEFERVLGGDDSALRPTPVDLDELAFHLDGPTDFDSGCMLELATGQLWPRDPEGMAGIEEPEDFDDPGAFVAVEGSGSAPGYGDMREFIEMVTDDVLAGRLRVAIQGAGAFRRFKDTLHRDEQWWGSWLTYSNERRLARARRWLSDAGYRPSTPENVERA